jgi:flagellin
MPVINENIAAMIAGDALNNSNSAMQVTLQRLSTGSQINQDSDNPAGLVESQQMQSQVLGMQMASQNIQDGVSLMNIASGCLSQVEDILQRIRELAVAASNDTMTSADRMYTQTETNQLETEVNSLTAGTEYNGEQLLAGTPPWGTGSGGTLHVGPNDTASGDIIQYLIPAVNTGSLGLSGMALTSQTDATAAINSVDAALNSVNTIQAGLGSVINRLGYALSNQQNQATNMQAANSVISDTDFAAESTEYSTNQIMIQSSTAMLAQANSLPQNLLNLLKS